MIHLFLETRELKTYNCAMNLFEKQKQNNKMDHKRRSRILVERLDRVYENLFKKDL